MRGTGENARYLRYRLEIISQHAHRKSQPNNGAEVHMLGKSVHDVLPGETLSVHNATIALPTKYDKQASDWMRTFGFTVKIAEGEGRCPTWGHERGCSHGDQYRVTLRAKPRRSFSFDWWGSIHMAQTGEKPRPYQVLSSLGSEAYMPTDPDEVAEEFGDMKPSQAIAIAKFAKRVQRFFSDDELTELAEIQ